MVVRVDFATRAACYRIEELGDPETGWEGAGRSVGKFWVLAGVLATVLQGGSLERNGDQHPRQHSHQHPDFS